MPHCYWPVADNDTAAAFNSNLAFSVVILHILHRKCTQPATFSRPGTFFSQKTRSFGDLFPARNFVLGNDLGKDILFQRFHSQKLFLLPMILPMILQNRSFSNTPTARNFLFLPMILENRSFSNTSRARNFSFLPMILDNRSFPTHPQPESFRFWQWSWKTDPFPTHPRP